MESLCVVSKNTVLRDIRSHVMASTMKSLLGSCMKWNWVNKKLLKKQQSVFKKMLHINDGAVTASYVFFHEIAFSSKPFAEEEFSKKCIIVAIDIVYPKKWQVFENSIVQLAMFNQDVS